jgi:hypothetical protein
VYGVGGDSVGGPAAGRVRVATAGDIEPAAGPRAGADGGDVIRKIGD